MKFIDSAVVVVSGSGLQKQPRQCVLTREPRIRYSSAATFAFQLENLNDYCNHSTLNYQLKESRKHMLILSFEKLPFHEASGPRRTIIFLYRSSVTLPACINPNGGRKNKTRKQEESPNRTIHLPMEVAIKGKIVSLRHKETSKFGTALQKKRRTVALNSQEFFPQESEKKKCDRRECPSVNNKLLTAQHHQQ